MLRKPFSRKKKTEDEIQKEALKAVLYNKDTFTGEHLANVHPELLENIVKENINRLDAKQTQKFAKIIHQKADKHAMDRGKALDRLSPEYETAHWNGESEQVRRKLARKSAKVIAGESDTASKEAIHEHADFAQKHVDKYAKVSELASQRASKLRNDAIASGKKPSERTLKKLSKIETTTQTTKQMGNLRDTFYTEKKERDLQKKAEEEAEKARQQRKEERGSSSPLNKLTGLFRKTSRGGSNRSASSKGSGNGSDNEGSTDGNKSAGNSPRGPQS